MKPNKVFSFSLLFASLAASVAPAADIGFDLTTRKTVRQNPTAVVFRDGYFQMRFHDGVFFYGGVCSPSPVWFPPSVPPGPNCPLGATGFVSTGPISANWGSPDPDTYWEVTTIQAAAYIEPFAANKISLIAAPASTLQRPTAPFEDASFSMFYNVGVASTDVREYRIANYGFNYNYGEVDAFGDVVPSAAQEKVMDDQIKQGIYNFTFPRVNYPDLKAAFAARYYPIPEGYRTIHNQKTGVKFTYPNIFDANGFALINSKDLKNPVKWQGISTNNAFPTFDKLYFSIKNLNDTANPNSESLETAIFPAFTSPSAATRILLQTPFISSYLLPPIIPAGEKGVIELELQRAATSNGVIYDRSSRRYQIPVYFGDHYEAYRQLTFKTAVLNTGYDDDYDMDGFTNIAEWILKSVANNRGSIPVAPVPKSYTTGGTTGTYFGFNVFKNLDAIPVVEYTITRSVNGGLTYTQMVTDANWTVIDTPTAIRIESNVKVAGKPVAPPGTSTHKYRIGVKKAP
jgi:hypothetical protein